MEKIDKHLSKEITKNEIADAIKKTGFVFEQRVAASIEQLGFSVMTNRAYLDETEGKSREVDIVALKEMFKITELNTKAICHMVCDCKDSTNPFVFFVRRKNWGDQYYRPQEIHLVHETYFESIPEGGSKKLDGFYYLGLDQHFFYTKEPTRAVQFCKITKNGSKVEVQSPGLIDSLIYPIVKAYRYHVGHAPRTNTVDKYCNVFLNFIIVNSALYTVDTEIDNADPQEVNYVPFIRHIHSSDINGTYLTTFIRHDYISTFWQAEMVPFFLFLEKKYQQNKGLVMSYSLDKLNT